MKSVFVRRYTLDNKKSRIRIRKDRSILLPTEGTKIFLAHTTLLEIQARRHRPPRSPTREGSHRLWVFPASALTLVLAGTYTLRVTTGDIDHP
ncbi:hypothetical protein AVEN_140787-1 [Araneus ventricosus]|uniref:Uncharacterized protein n=1 Tax=Araneus ventricosus TaxID=182803 RepID=A0A4Y2SRC6_ARAVE|nr:hypothetical protein AVEN_140787-1 [Araneus ventricosus]